MHVLWEKLIQIVQQQHEAAAERLTLIREDSTTSRIYGPSIGSLLDNHGQSIRKAGTAHAIQRRAANCTCMHKYPAFMDHTVGHVRTSDTSILPPQISKWAKLGLNFRPKFSLQVREIKEHIRAWAKSVLKKLRFKLIKANLEEILDSFMEGIPTKGSNLKPVPGLNLQQLATLAQKSTIHLVVTSTDKVAQTASIECIHWYRLVCLRRLQSDAFEACAYPDMLDIPFIMEFTPWEKESLFEPAILFGMPKQHKRHKDPLAYRYITAACSDKSKPLSDEALRVLTFLWEKSQYDCGKLSENTGAKFFWAIDSLDIVPFNTDTKECRLNRQPSAFDLEKCFESIPLFHSEHSLMNRMALFLDTVWIEDELVCSKNHNYLPGPKQECFWSHWESDYSYDRHSVLNLLQAVLNSAIITVGDSAAQQTLGIPMGFSVSVILLNIYMFTYEFEFVKRLMQNAPELAVHTREIYRYVDDLSNFSDLDLRPLLMPMAQEPADWKWIYPLAPWGPLTITDQTERLPERTRVIFLNMRFTLIRGFLAYSWYDKAKTYIQNMTSLYAFTLTGAQP